MRAGLTPQWNIFLSSDKESLQFRNLEQVSLISPSKQESDKDIKFYGDTKFSTCNQMCTTQTSRKEDLTSFFYLAIFLLEKELPWSDYVDCMPFKDKHQTFALIVDEKKKRRLSTLCGDKLPCKQSIHPTPAYRNSYLI